MQILNSKPITAEKRAKDLPDRLLEFAVITIKATYSFPKSQASAHISGQLIRSVTSAGANYEEACAAQSRADFIHKLQIALKELRETAYWIKLAEKLDLPNATTWENVAKEGKELLLIVAKSVVTSKGIAK
jgi:four helix bundle protein